MALINVRSSCHDFSVKLSLCIYSHTESSCPSFFAYVCNSWVSLVETFQHIYLCVTNPALYNDKLVNQCAAHSGSPRDDTSSHQFSNIQGFPGFSWNARPCASSLYQLGHCSPPMQPGHEANMKKRYQALPAFCTASDKSWVGPGNEASPLFCINYLFALIKLFIVLMNISSNPQLVCTVLRYKSGCACSTYSVVHFL